MGKEAARRQAAEARAKGAMLMYRLGGSDRTGVEMLGVLVAAIIVLLLVMWILTRVT